jgi:RNA polymerase sigma-70 factor (ECF subfamily)
MRELCGGKVENLSSVSIEDLLRRCCSSGNVAAWEEFVRRFHRLIATIVLRTANKWGDSSRQTADDLIQETYLKLCANNYRILREFEHRDGGAFVGYIKVLTANVVRDHFKSSYSKKRGANQVEGIPEGFVPAAGVDSAGSSKAIERSVLIQEVQRHLDGLVAGEDQERNNMVFWLYYRAGLSATAIAELPRIGLTTKGVESLILRITRELREQMTGLKSRGASIKRGAIEGISSAESF